MNQEPIAIDGHHRTKAATSPLKVGDWFSYATSTAPEKQYRARVMKLWPDGRVNLRVYLDGSETKRLNDRWYTWEHLVTIGESKATS